MRNFDKFYEKKVKIYEQAATNTNDPFRKKDQGQVVQQAQAVTNNPASAPNPASRPAPGAPTTTQVAPPGGTQGQVTAQPVAGATTTPVAAGTQQQVQITPANTKQYADALFAAAKTNPQVAKILNDIAATIQQPAAQG